jgi:hypothetical protein
MEVQAFALLCALGLVTFLSSVTRASQIGWFLAGVLAGVMLLGPSLVLLPWQPLLSSDPGQVSLLLFMLCFARLGNFVVRDYLLMLVAGVLAVIWLQALGALGYPSLFALLLVGATSFTALAGSLYRPNFRTAFLLDEALLIVMVYALALAIVPGAMSGWDAAVGLKSNVAEKTAAAERDFAVLWLAAGFAVLGAAYARWKQLKVVSKKYK